MGTKNIRNFAIIAHIDHGKSTLADRFLELTGTVSKRDMKEQLLDTMELERERGITIKLQPVRMLYEHSDRRKTQNDTLNNTDQSPQTNADNVQNNAENNLLYEDLTYKIRGALFEVKKKLGLGHKESVYHKAIEIELEKNNISFQSEMVVPVMYEGKKVGTYQPDFIIEDKIILELKALPEIARPQIEQIWSYLKGSEYKLALLASFGSKDLEIKRIVYDTARYQRSQNIAENTPNNAETSLCISASDPRPSAFSPRLSAGVSDQIEYVLNLIDTPGHVDFSYEVSRSLAAVEGALLVVDASQGIEAQTLSTLYAAIDAGLEIIPVVNKMDLPHAEPDKVATEIIGLLGCKKEEIIFASGKTGEGVPEILNRIVEKIPAPSSSVIPTGSGPTGEVEESLSPKALIFDSFYDSYKGVITYVRLFSGELRKGEKITLMAKKTPAEIIEIGILSPKLTPKDKLTNGEIGYIVTGLKEVRQARVGDTITSSQKPAEKPLPGYQTIKPFVFAGLFTTEGDDFPLLREALGKLSLSDSSLIYEPENSAALGFGFRCGFLGLLHMEIVKERLEREFNLDLIATAPSVSYEIKKTNGDKTVITSPTELPEKTQIDEIREPYVKLEIVTPADYIGPIMKLTQEKRGIYKNTSYLDPKRAVLDYECPLSGIVTDFFDRLKSVSSGYASLNYDFLGFRAENLVKIEILINNQPFDTLSLIAHKSAAQKEGEQIVKKLKELIPKQNFKIPIQAAIGGKIIAREDIPAFRKDVTAKLYGGDVTRKRKLLEKQKKGKKRMKMVGNVEIPSDTFINLLKN